MKGPDSLSLSLSPLSLSLSVFIATDDDFYEVFPFFSFFAVGKCGEGGGRRFLNANGGMKKRRLETGQTKNFYSFPLFQMKLLFLLEGINVSVLSCSNFGTARKTIAESERQIPEPEGGMNLL